MNLKNLEEKILNIDSSNINETDIKDIEEAIAALDQGEIRVAEEANGDWIINEWVREAVLLFFSIRNLKENERGDLIFYEKHESIFRFTCTYS